MLHRTNPITGNKMQSQFNTVSSHVNSQSEKKSFKSVKWVDPKIWKEKKHPQYNWALEQAKEKSLKTQVVATLQAIVACCDTEGTSRATIKSITDKRAKMFPGKPISQRTVERHIQTLSLMGCIERDVQEEWNRPVTTRLLRKNNVSCAQHDKMSNLSYIAIDIGLGENPPLKEGGVLLAKEATSTQKLSQLMINIGSFRHKRQ
jgi:DNA-directed RNA polymerase specialized sigma54-like protein